MKFAIGAVVYLLAGTAVVCSIRDSELQDSKRGFFWVGKPRPADRIVVALGWPLLLLLWMRGSLSE
jgi:hypothetical protein